MQAFTRRHEPTSPTQTQRYSHAHAHTLHHTRARVCIHACACACSVSTGEDSVGFFKKTRLVFLLPQAVSKVLDPYSAGLVLSKCVVCMSTWYGRALAVPSTLEPKPPSLEGMVLLPVALVYLTPPHPTLIGPDWGIEGKEIGLLCKVHRPIYASILQSCIWKNLP